MQVRASTLFKEGFNLGEFSGDTIEIVNDIGNKGELLSKCRLSSSGELKYSGKSKGSLLVPQCISKITMERAVVKNVVLHPKFDGTIDFKHVYIETMACNIGIKVHRCIESMIKELMLSSSESTEWEETLNSELYNSATKVTTDKPFIVLGDKFLPSGSISRYVRRDIINRANTLNSKNSSDKIVGVRPKDCNGSLEIKRYSNEISSVQVSYETYMNFCADYMHHLSLDKK